MVPAIRPASTVMLLRAGEPSASFEVLMLRRSIESAFAPDVYAFPGGAVEGGDYSDRLRSAIGGLDSKRLTSMFRIERTPALDDPDVAELDDRDRAALIVAALRELFEEGGVLLGNRANTALRTDSLQNAREALWRRSSDFPDVIEQHRLQLDASELELFSVWITPPNEARRFNAHFFVAKADDQAAAADRFETHDEIWIAPEDALRQYGAGRFAMVYPTIKHIERLAEFDSVDDVVEFARHKPIVRIMPNTTAEHGFTLPPELEKAW
ncbi:MAG: hypothetical protein JO135_09760 [Candidatus Eremiobacteraeota bacterium]|nr:hypothetical protein [Candidatus Eremiobacteraeota bacterium]